MAVAKEEDIGANLSNLFMMASAVLFKQDGQFKAFSKVCTHLGVSFRGRGKAPV